MGSRGSDVRRHSSGWGFWEAVAGQPHPALRGRVLRYTGYREQTAAPLRRRQLPSGEVTLIVSFDQPLRMVRLPDGKAGGATFTGFVAGLHTGPAVTEHAGRQQGIGVGLTPVGAFALFGMPMHLLAGGVVELSAVLGQTGADLEAALAEAPGWVERFALLDRVLLARMEAGPTPAPEVVWAWRCLCAARGRSRIGELAQRIGWSHRHLVARFHEQIGLAPKGMARVLRLQRLLALLERPYVSLGDLALTVGFYDQAHMNREFQALAGCTPTEWLAARLPGGAGTGA
jgi:AraC-like DNA-binding protein